MTDDVLTRLRAADPAQRTRIGRLDADACLPLLPTREPVWARRRRRVRPGVAVAVTAAMALGSGAAYAGYRQLYGPGADVNCTSTWHGPRQVESSGSLRTGDPVADCQYYQRLHGRASIHDPVAFQADRLVYVAPRTQVPTSARLLGPVTRDEQVGVELATTMQDNVDGLRSRCFDEPDAVAFARSQLRRLDLTGWSVTVVPAAPAQGPCSTGDVDARHRIIDILPQRESDWDPAHGRSDVFPWVYEIIYALREHVAARCLSVDDAEKATRKAFGEHEMQLRVVRDESAACTRVDATVPGVVLYGPSRARPS